MIGPSATSMVLPQPTVIPVKPLMSSTRSIREMTERHVGAIAQYDRACNQSLSGRASERIIGPRPGTVSIKFAYTVNLKPTIGIFNCSRYANDHHMLARRDGRF